MSEQIIKTIKHRMSFWDAFMLIMQIKLLNLKFRIKYSCPKCWLFTLGIAYDKIAIKRYRKKIAHRSFKQLGDREREYTVDDVTINISYKNGGDIYG